MNKFYDIVLGWPGVVVFIILVCVCVALTPNDNNLQKQCENQGGRWVQTMKTYHECRINK